MLELLGFVFRNWLVVASSSIVVGALMGILALVQTPIYRAEVVLSPAAEESGPSFAALGALSGMASLAGIDLGGSQQERREAVAALSSRRLAVMFIEKHDLMPQLFNKQWDEEAGKWKSSRNRKEPNLWDGSETFLRDVLRVIEDKHTGLISLTVDWTDPFIAAEWANSYVSLANETLRVKALEEATASVNYLRAELSKIDTVELRQTIYSLMEMRLKEQVMANVRDEFAFRVIDPAMSEPNRKPHRPKLFLMVASGLMLGFLLGLIVAREFEVRRLGGDGKP
jgi:uncharacterized protein involved in exopolysaccharide biosynthesis